MGSPMTPRPMKPSVVTPGARTLRDGGFAPRAPRGSSEHRRGVAVQDQLARLVADLGFGERLAGPVAAELGAVGAADDAIGAVEPHRRFDRARTERVAVHVHPGLPEARRGQLLVRRVEQTAMVHAL